jgi:erythromycin esterase-like protein
MGFDVLAFESSIYECFAADLRQLPATDALLSTIFGVWAFEEVLPLFEYLKQTQATARPLAFSGFDPQISSRTGVATRPAFFQRVVGVLDPGYANEVAAFDAQFIDRIQREGRPTRAMTRIGWWRSTTASPRSLKPIARRWPRHSRATSRRWWPSGWRGHP